MRYAVIFLLGFLLGACGQAKAPEATRIDAHDLAEKTVALIALQEGQAPRAYCSGVWIADERIVTAAHCIHEPIVVYAVESDLPNPSGRLAILEVLDEGHDLAILAAPGAPVHRVARVAVGAKAGDRVATMGHPKGLWWSYSSGDVAAIRKIDAQPDIFYIQTTAPTSKGNSGCGLFDEAGNLLGIAHAGVVDGQNLNFYIHGQYVQALLGGA